MLYDPKWEVETKADPLSLESLIAWLETMPASGEYDFDNCQGECLVGQYLRSIGKPWSPINYFAYRDAFADPETGTFRIGVAHPRTFGAALERARAAQP